MKDIISDSISAAHKAWGWYFALGIVLVLLGIVAVIGETTATLASVVALGAIVLFAGVAHVASAFIARGPGHVILLLLVGVLDIVVGAMLVGHPLAGALTVTLLLAALLVFGGIFRIVSALWLRFPRFGWVALSGLVTFLLGLILWIQWPFSATWFLGLAIGLNFILAGMSWSMLAWKLKGP
jgi:uncharacterized membrane protein HdeD (DUF308 family)